MRVSHVHMWTLMEFSVSKPRRTPVSNSGGRRKTVILFLFVTSQKGEQEESHSSYSKSLNLSFLGALQSHWGSFCDLHCEQGPINILQSYPFYKAETLQLCFYSILMGKQILFNEITFDNSGNYTCTEENPEMFSGRKATPKRKPGFQNRAPDNWWCLKTG